MNKNYYLLFVLVFFTSIHVNIYAQTEVKPGIQAVQEFKSATELEYLLYLPNGYDEDQTKQWPVILFLHGAGERGNNVKFVKKWGPPKVAEEKGLPFILVSPQCPTNYSWSNLLEPIKQLLDEVLINYRADMSRIYLTGLSMGGYGTFLMMENYPQYFAAYAPICGGGNPSNVGRYSYIPGWVFHGDKDQVVPISNSQAMVDSLKAKGADVKFTIYEGVGHNSWTNAYWESGLFDWFLKQKRKY